MSYLDKVVLFLSFYRSSNIDIFHIRNTTINRTIQLSLTEMNSGIIGKISLQDNLKVYVVQLQLTRVPCSDLFWDQIKLIRFG